MVLKYLCQKQSHLGKDLKSLQVQMGNVLTEVHQEVTSGKSEGSREKVFRDLGPAGRASPPGPRAAEAAESVSLPQL